MAKTSRSTTSARASVPHLYRFLLTTVEPVFAVSGALLTLYKPSMYHSILTRTTVATFDPSTTFLYTSLIGAWLHFAFIEAVVLRATDDLKIWRLACWGMLLSDLAFVYSTAQAVGGWAEWMRVANWTVGDWGVFWGTAPFVVVRVLMLLGVGVAVQGTRKGV